MFKRHYFDDFYGKLLGGRNTISQIKNQNSGELTLATAAVEENVQCLQKHRVIITYRYLDSILCNVCIPNPQYLNNTLGGRDCQMTQTSNAFNKHFQILVSFVMPIKRKKEKVLLNQALIVLRTKGNLLIFLTQIKLQRKTQMSTLQFFQRKKKNETMCEGY